MESFIGVVWTQGFSILDEKSQGGGSDASWTLSSIVGVRVSQQCLHAESRTVIVDRVLQNSTTGKSLEFLELGSSDEVGGDGTVGEESLVLKNDGDGHSVDTA